MATFFLARTIHLQTVHYNVCILCACAFLIHASFQAHRNLMEECRTLRRELMEKKIACTRTKRQPNVVSVKT